MPPPELMVAAVDRSMIIRESKLHGGNSWLDYDRVFRQQAAIDQTLLWSTLHPGIQAATLVGRSTGPATFCTLSREPDHSVQPRA